jgi:hypothetical protein
MATAPMMAQSVGHVEHAEILGSVVLVRQSMR